MNKKKEVFEFTLTSIFSAIILLMSFFPEIGFITIIPGISITLVHIPVLIGVFLLPFNKVLILGFFFGVGSLFKALMSASNPFDMAFFSPLVSILPRILFAAAACFIAGVFKKIFNLKHGKKIVFMIVVLISSFSIFFGIHQISIKWVYSDYNLKLIEYNTAKSNETTQENLKELEDEVILLKNKADNISNENQIYLIILSLVVISLLISFYYYEYRKKDGTNIYIVSVFIISTIIHTFLVVSSIAIFNPSAFKAVLGSNENVVTIIYFIAMTNGLIEAVVGSFIGTPITIAAKSRLESD